MNFAKLLRQVIFGLFIIISTVTPLAAAPQSVTPHRFSWGAEVGGAVDMTGNDMSAITLDAYFGYQNSWISMLGVGAEVQSMVNESRRSFPFYAIFRTNFSRRPSLCFLSLKVGGIYNDFADYNKKGALLVAPAIGFNLAKGKSFQSYITVGYLYNGLKCDNHAHHHNNIKGLHEATISLGISF